MKPYGAKKDWNAWDDFTKKACPAFSDTKANKNKATRKRCKKTLKTRGRKIQFNYEA
jgi:hypothetical protein